MRIEEFARILQTSESKKAKTFRANIEAALPGQLEHILSPRFDAESAKEWLNTKDGFLAMQPRLEKAKNDAIARFRENELPKILHENFEKRYREKHPPQNCEVTKLIHELEAVRRKAREVELRAYAQKAASELGIPFGYVDHLILDEEEKIRARLEQFNKYAIDRANEIIQEWFKGFGYVRKSCGSCLTEMQRDPKAPPEAQMNVLFEHKRSNEKRRARG
jgi:hypothetical protein